MAAPDHAAGQAGGRPDDAAAPAEPATAAEGEGEAAEGGAAAEPTAASDVAEPGEAEPGTTQSQDQPREAEPGTTQDRDQPREAEEAPTPSPGAADGSAPRSVGAAVEVPAAVAWSRLRGSLRGRPSRLQALAGVLLFLLGFAVVTQARQTSESGLAALRESDLVRLLDDVTERRERLEAESSDLQEQRNRLLNSSDADDEARRAADERLDTYAILAGTAPAVGPGITLVVRDPGGEVDAPFLLDAVQELRDAGAEAIQIGEVRIVASTAFVDVSDGVQVDGSVERPPYTITAIGDPDVLVPALRIPGGVLQGLTQRGAEGVVTERDEVIVEALRVVDEPEYARPAQPEE